MTGEKSWLDARVCDLPSDENGEQVLSEMTQALADTIQSLRPYVGVLAELMTVDLDQYDEECCMTIRVIIVAQSSVDTALCYDGCRQFCSLDTIGKKRRLTPLFDLESLWSAKKRSNLRILFGSATVLAMTSRELVTGINALKHRVQEVVSVGVATSEELRCLLSE